MNYRDFLEDPPSGVDPCYELDAETREAVASGIDELATFEKLWRWSVPDRPITTS